MPFEIKVEPDFVRATVWGVLTEADLWALVDAAEAIERSSPRIPDRLTDLTGVEGVQLGFPAVRALAERRRTAAFPNAFKSALVARDPVMVGFARMFQTLNDSPQITIEIFSDEDAALAWLRD